MFSIELLEYSKCDIHFFFESKAKECALGGLKRWIVKDELIESGGAKVVG